MRFKVQLFISFAVLVLAFAPSMAQAIIIPGMSTDPTWLSIDYHRVNVAINEQVATTEVAMQFTNNGEQMAEGTFLFPLPRGAAVERLVMVIDGVAIEAQILPAAEARGIYDEIVRQFRDPALLEYVGQDLLQANVFPIPPNESRRIEISYGQLLPLDNGLVHYVYPLHAAPNGRTVEQMNISVSVTDNNAISSVYSPSHSLAIARPSDFEFRAGFETTDFVATGDFSLYYGVARDAIDISAITYRESATEDGFFMLMVQPPIQVAQDQIVPKDVVLVIDQSGSMSGTKWTQAQAAASYVLDNLNVQDRFNVIAFSTGWRVYGNGLLDANQAQDARQWVNGLFADGGTDIHGALYTALALTGERPMNIIFMTDGEATEGITETQAILSSLEAIAPANARIFTFGVGDDVNTLLLDAIVRDFRGTSAYVRPTERIEEEVASLFNKINAPVMTDVTLTIDGATTELMYPAELGDLFVGEQVTMVGRYRNVTNPISISLSGTVNGEARRLVYEGYTFPNVAGGESFIAQLWATRRIGDLLNSIRLNGESEELVNSVVNLSIRYGIITPYTSFLIQEDDILSQRGREEAAESFAAEAEALANTATGSSAVNAADAVGGLSRAAAPMPAAPSPTQMAMAPSSIAPGGSLPPSPADEDGAAMGGEGNVSNPIQTVGDKTFILQDGVWTDTTYSPDAMETTAVKFLSDAYFDLLTQYPEAGQYLAIGERMIVVLDGTAYEIVTE